MDLVRLPRVLGSMHARLQTLSTNFIAQGPNLIGKIRDGCRTILAGTCL